MSNETEITIYVIQNPGDTLLVTDRGKDSVVPSDVLEAGTMLYTLGFYCLQDLHRWMDWASKTHSDTQVNFSDEFVQKWNNK